MAKEKFIRKKTEIKLKPVDHGHDQSKQVLTETIKQIMAKKNDGTAKGYEQIDCTPDERGITIRSTSLNTSPSSFFNNTKTDPVDEATPSERLGLK